MAPVWAKPVRKGKIVRIDRPRAARADDMRICPMPFADEQEGSCYGGSPRVGQKGHLFDYEENYLGTLKVLSVRQNARHNCHHGTTFDFKYELDLRAQSNNSLPFGIAVFGVQLEPNKARMISEPDKMPQLQPDQTKPWMGLDRDGDGDVDFVVSAFECTDIEPPPASSGQALETYCLDYWLPRDGAWTSVRRDIFYTCA